MIDDSVLKRLRMPEKFQSLRPHQGDAIQHIEKFDRRWLMQIAPTGIGKSLIYVCGALLREGSVVILTSTKALQDQLMMDFGSAGMVEVRGRANYRCELTGLAASLGPCRWSVSCALRDSGCPYFDAARRALASDLVVTNYAFWLCNDSLQDVDTLVLDEAHASFNHLVSHYAVHLDLGMLEYYMGYDVSDTITKLKTTQVVFATLEKKLQEEAKRLLKEGGNFKILQTMSNTFENIRSLRALLKARHEFLQERQGRDLYIHPITAPSDALFKEVGSIVLTSATVSRGTAELLGIPDVNLEVREYPSCFPQSNRPIYMMHPGVRVDEDMNETHEKAWAGQIDRIIRNRRGYKGIVHTVSYARQELFSELSREGPHLVPGSKDVAQAIRQFKSQEEPKVLVSPSVTTGYDFPGDECRYQVIAKVPFPNAESEIQKKRAELFPSYPLYHAWQQLIQAAGRGVRSEDDWCETFVIDSHFHWLKFKYNKLAPRWFIRAIKKQHTIPRRSLNGIV